MNHKWKTKCVIYPRSAQPLHWMPGLQPGWTRKDTQHFPIFTMTEKLSMLYVPALHWSQDFSLGEPKRKDNFPYINREWKTMLYILEGLYTQYQDKQHLPAILIYEIWQIITKKYIYIMVYISEVIRPHKTKEYYRFKLQKNGYL